MSRTDTARRFVKCSRWAWVGGMHAHGTVEFPKRAVTGSFNVHAISVDDSPVTMTRLRAVRGAVEVEYATIFDAIPNLNKPGTRLLILALLRKVFDAPGLGAGVQGAHWRFVGLPAEVHDHPLGSMAEEAEELLYLAALEAAPALPTPHP